MLTVAAVRMSPGETFVARGLLHGREQTHACNSSILIDSQMFENGGTRASFVVNISVLKALQHPSVI